MLKKLIFISIIVAIPLMTIEVLFQGVYYLTTGALLFQRMALPIFENDETRCYRVSPNLTFEHRTPEYAVTYYTNARGFRTDARREVVEIPKPDNRYRILFLGPSFPFGWANEFEDAYATLITWAMLEAGRDVDAVNLGTPNQTRKQQLCWLKAEGRLFDPDLIIQTVYGGISIGATACSRPLNCPILEGGYLTSSPRNSLAQRAIVMAKSSALVFYTWYFFASFVAREVGETTDPRHTRQTNATLGENGDEIQSLVETYHAYVRTIRTYVSGNVNVVFVIIPMAFVVHEQDEMRWVHRNVEDTKRQTRLVAPLAAELAGDGVTFIDMTSALREAGQRERMYYWLDIHLTPAGNKVVADAMVPIVRTLIEAAQDE